MPWSRPTPLVFAGQVLESGGPGILAHGALRLRRVPRVRVRSRSSCGNARAGHGGPADAWRI